jgi:O-antigen/teichoic acid export membrane protein
LGLKKKLFSGSAIRLTHLFLEIIVGFLLMPYLVSELTEKWYGLWLLVASITGFFALLTLGLSSAVQRYLSYEISSGDTTGYKRTVSSALFVFTISGALAISLSLLIAYFSEFFVDSKELETIFSSLVLIVGCNFALRFFSTPFNAALTAEFHFIHISFFEIIGFVVKSGLTVYFVDKGLGVIGLAYALIVGEVFANLSIVLLAVYKLNNFRFSFAFIDKKKVAELFEYGLNSFLATLGTMLRFPLGNIVISGVIGLSAITIYSIPVRLLSYADAFITTSVGVLQPYFTKLYANKKLEELGKIFILSSMVTMGLGGVLAGGLFVFGADFIGLWVKEYQETKLLTLILPWTLLFGICQYPSMMVLYSLGKHKYFAYLNLAEVLVNLCLAAILINFFGVVGVALAVVLPMLITKCWLLPKYVCLQLSIPLKRYYAIFMKFMLFTVLYSTVWLYMSILITGWLDIFLWGSIYAFIYLLLFFFTVIEYKEQKTIKKMVINKLTKN